MRSLWLAPDQLAQQASNRPVAQSGEDGQRAAGRVPSDWIICQPNTNKQDEMLWEGFRPPPAHLGGELFFSVALHRGEEGEAEQRGGGRVSIRTLL